MWLGELTVTPMTIAVYWDVKQQTKPTIPYCTQNGQNPKDFGHFECSWGLLAILSAVGFQSLLKMTKKTAVVRSELCMCAYDGE